MKVAQSCLTLWPHWLGPARLLCPWNSPCKNTGVGSCSLLQGIFPAQGSNLGHVHCRWILYCLIHQRSPRYYMKWKWKLLSLLDSLWPHGLYSPWNSPGQNTGVGDLSLLRGILPTQGLNPGLPHCGYILYQLNCQGSPASKTSRKSDINLRFWKNLNYLKLENLKSSKKRLLFSRLKS